MTTQITDRLLAHLLESAAPVQLEREEKSPSRNSASNDNVDHDMIAEAEAMLRFLVDKGISDFSEYGEWLSLGFALRHAFGDSGFDLFDRLSSEAANYDPDACQRKWESVSREEPPANPLTLATYYGKARDGGWRPNKRIESVAGASGKADPAAIAVQLAIDAGDEIWLDEQGRPHVSYDVPVGDRIARRHARVDSDTYKNLLGNRYYREMVTKVLSKDQAGTAAQLLAHGAEGGGRFVAHLRVGGAEDGAIYIDLGRDDGKTVRVDSTGWSVVDNPPVRFVRGSRGQLPLPERGGQLSDFSAHLNLGDEDLVRVLAFMIGTFNTQGSFPILFVDGEQGSGKSMLADMTVECVDPPMREKGARTTFNPEERDLHLYAENARLLYFDNVSSFSATAADMLCRLATGAASQRRKLYTDSEESWMVVNRPVLVTCIGLPSARADLLDRSLWVKALPIKRRRAESTVRQAFLLDRPKLFGFVLTCLSAALKNRVSVQQAVDDGAIRLPRMGDFAQFVEGAAHLLGLEVGQFSEMIADDQSRAQRRAAQDDPIGMGLLQYFSRPDAKRLVGPARHILDVIRSNVPEGTHLPPANKFGGALSRIGPGLRALGFEYDQTEPSGHDNVLKFEIWMTDRFRPLAPQKDHDAF